MTISRCEVLAANQVTFQYVSAEDPDSIGVEVLYNDHVLFSVDMMPDGSATILFDQIRMTVFDLVEFYSITARCRQELEAWRERLIVPGGIWEQAA